MTDRCAGCGADVAAMDPGRRRFIERSLLAAVGAVLATACGDGQIGATGPSRGAPPPPVGGPLVVTLADFPALAAVGGIARVDAGTVVPIAAVRLGAASFAAFSMICTHQGYRPIGIQGPGFVCPNHGAQFHPDGTWAGGQPTTNLRTYEVEYDPVAETLTIG